MLQNLTRIFFLNLKESVTILLKNRPIAQFPSLRRALKVAKNSKRQQRMAENGEESLNKEGGLTWSVPASPRF